MCTMQKLKNCVKGVDGNKKNILGGLVFSNYSGFYKHCSYV